MNTAKLFATLSSSRAAEKFKVFFFLSLGSDVGNAPGAVGEVEAFREAEAVDEVVDDDAGGLHEGVDDDGANEAEAAADEVLAHRL